MLLWYIEKFNYWKAINGFQPQFVSCLFCVIQINTSSVVLESARTSNSDWVCAARLSSRLYFRFKARGTTSVNTFIPYMTFILYGFPDEFVRLYFTVQQSSLMKLTAEAWHIFKCDRSVNRWFCLSKFVAYMIGNCCPHRHIPFTVNRYYGDTSETKRSHVGGRNEFLLYRRTIVGIVSLRSVRCASVCSV